MRPRCPEPVRVPIRVPDPQTVAETAEKVGVGVAVVGGVIVVATIAEDVITGGAGIADDPATLGAGFSMMATGLGLK